MDAFGSALATVEGRPGGRVVLVIAPPELARLALDAMLALPPFAGRAVLAVVETAHAAPLEAVVRATAPAAAIALEPHLKGVATFGSGIAGEAGHHASSTGLEYAEPGAYPEWSGGWLAERFASPLDGESRAASVASSLGVAVVACGPNDLEGALERALA